MPLSIPALLTALGVAMAAERIFPPFGDIHSQWTNSIMPKKIPDIGSLLGMRYKKVINESEYNSNMLKLGYTEEWAKEFSDANIPLFDLYDSISAWRRKIQTEAELDNDLRLRGFTTERISVLKQVTEYFPSPVDLVRFAVREVYTPSVRSEYGMDDEYPTEFAQESNKAGLSIEQSKNYWAAHWQLPSAGDGFEMLHRGILTEAQVQLLLKTLDYMPYWRDKIIKLSYSPLTRVDVRRMYRLGVVDETAVYKSYLALGYSPENAGLMTEFTKKYESGEDTGVTRAALVTAYKRDVIDKEQLIEYLTILDYAPDTVEFWVSMAEYEKTQEDTDMRTDDMLARYHMGELNMETLRVELNTLGLPATFVDTLINKEKAQTSSKLKLPTKSELSEWLHLGIINDITFAEKMKALGYKEADIINYLLEFGLTQDIAVQKYAGAAVYQRWLKHEIISEEYFITIMTEQGYTESDIASYVIEVREVIESERNKAVGESS